MELTARIREAQERWNVLEHSFYERWDGGALTAEELQTYAGQYRHAVTAVARAARASAAYGTPEHAAEEAAHVTLWDAWATAVGGDPAEAAPETVRCVESWAPSDPLVATAVLYAVESTQPAIAETKLRGLVRHYGFDEGSPALAYFRIHAERDHDHAERAEQILAAEAGPEDTHRLAAAAEAALGGNWQLLDGVERLNRR